MGACIFCRIIRGEIRSPIVQESEHVLVISDIAPKAPIHYLILPKKHIENMASITTADKDICWAMWDMAQRLSKDLPDQAFNVIVNNGAAAGQSVFHLHWHFIAGKNIYSSGFSL
ncbi:MAG: HIT domain-containing protein [Candidatus Babeliales bacterium]